MPSPNSYALIEIKHAEPAGMSRLGQNRTLWGQAPMSALPPKAEIDLELYPSAASIAELCPDLVAETKRRHLSLRAIAAELAKCGHFNERGNPFWCSLW